MRLRMEGTSLAMRVTCPTPSSHIAVLVDGEPPRIVRLPKGESFVALADGLAPGTHAVDVVHRTETWQGIVTVHGFVLKAGGNLLPPLPWPDRRMLFIGDSVTCGEGIDRRADCKKEPSSWNAYLSFGMVLARALDAQAHLVSYGGRGLIRDWQGRRDVLNAPQFFDLAIADEKVPLAWDHAAYRPDAVVVSLGTNDFNLALGALPAREEYTMAYVAFVRKIRSVHPDAHIFVTEGAIVNDETDPKRPQRTVLREYIAETARRLGDAKVHVVRSQRYPGDACDSHPTREQHAKMARDLEPVIRQTMGW
jgi:lysophospholipase L1-like esterase